MHSRIWHLITLISIALTAAALAACSGGTGSTGMGGTGQMKLQVADQPPVDGAERVLVRFSSVELIPNSGNPVTIPIDPTKQINLLTDGGTASAILFDQPIPAGSYSQVRLTVVSGNSASNPCADSCVQLSDGSEHTLMVPSGAQTGLKLVSGFTVPASGVVDYTIDFNLRASITCPPGQSPTCLLRPALRLVNDDSVGNIAGTVDNALVTTGCYPGVYLYSGNVTSPADMNTMSSNPDTQPINSFAPVGNSNPPYYYQFTFLPPGTYTVAFTCNANLDNPTQADSNVTFNKPAITNITVTAGQTTTVNIPNTSSSSSSSI